MRLLAGTAVVFLLLSSCASDPQPHDVSAPHEKMRSEDVLGPGAADLRDVMQSKIAYSSALLQGIAIRDYVQIEHNAESLERLSREASFIVHDTVAYRAFSDRFHEQAKLLAKHAHNEDQAAIEADYHAITDTCFRCHQYVRQEHFKGSMPGQISRR